MEGPASLSAGLQGVSGPGAERLKIHHRVGVCGQNQQALAGSQFGQGHAGAQYGQGTVQAANVQDLVGLLFKLGKFRRVGWTHAGSIPLGLATGQRPAP